MENENNYSSFVYRIKKIKDTIDDIRVNLEDLKNENVVSSNRLPEDQYNADISFQKESYKNDFEEQNRYYPDNLSNNKGNSSFDQYKNSSTPHDFFNNYNNQNDDNNIKKNSKNCNFSHENRLNYKFNNDYNDNSSNMRIMDKNKIDIGNGNKLSKNSKDFLRITDFQNYNTSNLNSDSKLKLNYNYHRTYDPQLNTQDKENTKHLNLENNHQNYYNYHLERTSELVIRFK